MYLLEPHVLRRDFMDEKNKKTIFLTVGRAIISRNLLCNSFFSSLISTYNVVLFVPSTVDTEFEEHFSGLASIERLQPRVLSGFSQKIDNFFVSLHKALIYNSTVEVRTTYGLLRRGSVRYKRFRQYLQKYFFGLFLSRIHVLKQLVKYIDARIFFSTIKYKHLIEHYKPDLVFITNIASEEEIELLYDCKRLGVGSIGMVKSWDSTSKFGFRGTVDHVVVWGDYMKEEFTTFQRYAPENISVIGVPQFDYYVNGTVMNRNDFFELFSLNPDFPYIFFGSEGPVCEDEEYVISVILDAIEDGRLPNYQLLIRPHFGYKNQMHRFDSFLSSPHVRIDKQYIPSSFPDGMEWGTSSIVHLRACLHYADAVVTSASTLVLDALANNSYPILFHFDKNKDTKYAASVKRLYDTSWFQEIGKMSLHNKANNEQDFIHMIQHSLEYKHKYTNQMLRTIQHFCHKVDGESGQRLYSLIHSILK